MQNIQNLKARTNEYEESRFCIVAKMAKRVFFQRFEVHTNFSSQFLIGKSGVEYQDWTRHTNNIYIAKSNQLTPFSILPIDLKLYTCK